MNLSCQNPAKNVRQRLPKEFYEEAKRIRHLDSYSENAYAKEYEEYHKNQHELLLKMIGNSQTNPGEHPIERERIIESACC